LSETSATMMRVCVDDNVDFQKDAGVQESDGLIYVHTHTFKAREMHRTPSNVCEYVCVCVCVCVCALQHQASDWSAVQRQNRAAWQEALAM